ncbi:small ribosomal subunit protein mS23 isoform X2 [Antennarius striatus]
MKPPDVPIWYNVYKAFPPLKDPLYVKPYFKPHVSRTDVVPDIFYPEDAIRAIFYERYLMGHLDLSNPNFTSMCQRFVDKYVALAASGVVPTSDLLQETEKALLKDGIMLKRRGAQRKSKSQDPTTPESVSAGQQPMDDSEDAAEDTPTHPHTADPSQ